MRSSAETLPLPRTGPAGERRPLPTWLPLAKRLALIAAQLAVVATVLWFGLPQSLGGRAGWVVISGTSMLPRMHTGDLALVERQSSYHVGEVVAYRVPKGEVGAGYEVIHRIVGGNAKTGWIVKGDNRTGPDVWHPTNSDIVGARLLWVPKAYLVLRFLHTPLLLGLLAAFGIFFTILLGGKGDAEPEVVEEES
jgi:signal peptidase I